MSVVWFAIGFAVAWLAACGCVAHVLRRLGREFATTVRTHVRRSADEMSVRVTVDTSEAEAAIDRLGEKAKRMQAAVAEAVATLPRGAVS